MIDRLIAGFDWGLRTLAGTHKSTRPSPSTGMPEPELSAGERELAARLMRVNHCGEVCAQALYQGQALTSGNPELASRFVQAAREEADHLAWSAERIRELGGH